MVPSVPAFIAVESNVHAAGYAAAPELVTSVHTKDSLSMPKLV
jgi:hypothetical protein